jgi:hypothetical protein
LSQSTIMISQPTFRREGGLSSGVQLMFGLYLLKGRFQNLVQRHCRFFNVHVRSISVRARYTSRWGFSATGRGWYVSLVRSGVWRSPWRLMTYNFPMLSFAIFYPIFISNCVPGRATFRRGQPVVQSLTHHHQTLASRLFPMLFHIPIYNGNTYPKYERRP